MTLGTLATYRWMGVGPAFRKIRNRIVYDTAELDAWCAEARKGWSPRELAAARAAQA
jgi:hypothetical protein